MGYSARCVDLIRYIGTAAVSKRTLAQLDPAHLDGQRAWCGWTSTSRSRTAGSPTTPASARRCRRSSTCATRAPASCCCRTSAGPRAAPIPSTRCKPLARELEKLLGAPVEFIADPDERRGRRRRCATCRAAAWRWSRTPGSIPARRRTTRRWPTVRRARRLLRQRRVRLGAPRPRQHRGGRASAQARGRRVPDGAGARATSARRSTIRSGRSSRCWAAPRSRARST